MSNTLSVSFTGGCLDGKTVTLTLNSNQTAWTGPVTVNSPGCGGTYTFVIGVECDASAGLDINWTDCCIPGTVQGTLTTTDCQTYTGTAVSLGAPGSYGVTLTNSGTGTCCGSCADASPSSFSFTGSGFTSGPGCGSDCTSLNTTFTLTQNGTCSWASPTFSFCNGTSQWIIVYSSGSTQLRLMSGTGPSAALIAGWAYSGCPTSGMTLTYGAGGLSGCGWPMIITCN